MDNLNYGKMKDLINDLYALMLKDSIIYEDSDSINSKEAIIKIAKRVKKEYLLVEEYCSNIPNCDCPFYINGNCCIKSNNPRNWRFEDDKN